MSSFCHWAMVTKWLLLVVFVFPILAAAQASYQNPFFWQAIVEYDIGRSNQSQLYLPSTSTKVYSQDFQTVFGHNDYFGYYTSRLLLDFGDGCPGTTMDDIQALNGNTATSPSMMSQPSIALVERGGRCDAWTAKLNQTMALSEQYNLDVTAVLLYDNATYDQVRLIHQDTTNAISPVWPSTALPPARNVSDMLDNDVWQHLGSVFVAVYFAPSLYGLLLKDLVRNYTVTPSTDMMQRYVQLTALFSDKSFSVDQSGLNNTNNSSGGGDDNNQDVWGVFASDHGYLAYIIAAAAALVLGVVLIRWCRTPRAAAEQQQQQQDDPIYMTTMNTTATGGTSELLHHHMSLTKLNELCPVQELKDATATMKNTVCAICLEELVRPDTLVRILPCRHGFCVACIDVWLTKKASVCPICKFDCDPQESPTSIEAPSPVHLRDSHAVSMAPSSSSSNDELSTTPHDNRNDIQS